MDQSMDDRIGNDMESGTINDTDSATDNGTGMVQEPLVEGRVSTPDAETARRIAEDLVGHGDAACVQVLGPMASIYQWQGEVHRSNEYLLLVKTTRSAFTRVVDAVRRHHRYEVPEVIAVPVTHALAEYGEWVVTHSRGRREGNGSGTSEPAH